MIFEVLVRKREKCTQLPRKRLLAQTQKEKRSQRHRQPRSHRSKKSPDSPGQRPRRDPKEIPSFAWSKAETRANIKNKKKKKAAESHIATVEGLTQPVVLV